MTDPAARVALVASLTAPPTPEQVEALAARADILEVRADLTGDLEAAWLRQRFPGRLLYTLRSAAEGGAATLSALERQARLIAAGEAYDLVDLEAARDLEPAVLTAIGAERRLVSWHGVAGGVAELDGLFERMLACGATYFKLAPEAPSVAAGAVPLALLTRRRRADLVAFATGEAGFWTRPLSAHLGAPLVFAAAGATPAAPGQPTLERLRSDYGLPALRPARRLFGVVGNPVSHSLSPRLHNGLYRRLGLDALYLAFHVEEFGRFWLDFVEADLARALGLPLEGLSVTAPHKRIALAVAGAVSPLAERIGAANTLVRRRGVWEAEATDPEGVVGPLRERGLELRGCRAAVLGAGGAGLAAALALLRSGARVHVFNRSLQRARAAALRLGVPCAGLDELDASRYDVLVNATPLGRQGEAPPFPVADLGAGAVIVDMVYRPRDATPLVAEARRRGLAAVDGREVLLHQAALQFRMMTGQELPLEEGRRLLA